ncbi:E3 ubiquitin- ligase RNF25 [Chlorella sorokiniana]|uniref:E3 ubiquitin-ligase RNF25 n=1 Tax=Chlorella sorokiniana TaxID=3076 RepID=A0A2P6TV23_CHLSO|nr:E3 ubiquitin- ligase RNF25 [Chlorella sorokiniana]|eukprot:PRW57917.1 E3 ubiquitin- ligase RNF25 [Chlorella sorokiniana]
MRSAWRRTETWLAAYVLVALLAAICINIGVGASNSARRNRVQLASIPNNARPPPAALQAWPPPLPAAPALPPPPPAAQPQPLASPPPVPTLPPPSPAATTPVVKPANCDAAPAALSRERFSDAVALFPADSAHYVANTVPGAVLDAATGARYPSYYNGAVPANCIVQVEGKALGGNSVLKRHRALLCDSKRSLVSITTAAAHADAPDLPPPLTACQEKRWQQAAMEGLPEEFEFELEALRATYGDEAVQVEPANSAAGGSGSSSSSSPPVAVVSVPVAPRCEAEPEQFVAGRLVMAVGAGYPAEPPAVQLADAKGMGDARLAGIQSSLAAEAASMAGELQLGHLCETALDLLTAANQPEGDCAFCLEPLLGQADSNGRGGRSRLPVVRLACYHCYHTACFAPWWQWQQRRSAQREAQLWSEYKSMAPLKLEEEGIRREPLSWLGGGAASSGGSTSFGGAANGVAVAAAEEEEQEAEDEEDGSGGSKGPGDAYVLLCPACRADIVPSSLAHAWQQLQASTADSWSGGAQGGGSSRAALIGLPPEQRQALLTMQQRHAAVMRRQQACGGIVDATHSVSISDLQQAAAAAAAAEAAAAEAAALAAAQQAQQPVQQAQAGRGGGRRGRVCV